MLIANPSSTDTTATIRLIGAFADGPFTIALPAHSRRSVSMADVIATLRPDLAVIDMRAFSIVVESGGPGIVVERSLYQDYGGVTWAAGTALLGTPLTP